MKLHTVYMTSKNSGTFIIDKKTASKRTISAFIHHVQQQGASVCTDMIQQNYIKHAAWDADYIIVIGEQIGRRLRSGVQQYNFNKIKAFVLLKRPKRTQLYVDLICGKGGGKPLFRKIDELAVQLGVNEVKLSAIPSAMLQYYRAYNFKFSETCKENTVVTALAIHAINKTEVLKEMRQSRSQAKTPREKQHYQRLSIDALRKAKAAVGELEEVLASMNIVHNKGCKTPRKCGIDGYSMTKCLRS